MSVECHRGSHRQDKVKRVRQCCTRAALLLHTLSRLYRNVKTAGVCNSCYIVNVKFALIRFLFLVRRCTEKPFMSSARDAAQVNLN